jgi:hypothetical protein
MQVQDLTHTPILDLIVRPYAVEYITYLVFIKKDEDKNILRQLMNYNISRKTDRLSYEASNTLNTITLTITI